MGYGNMTNLPWDWWAILRLCVYVAIVVGLLIWLCACSCLPIDYSCQDPDHPPHYGMDGHNECSR